MIHRYLIAAGLFTALTAFAAPAPERDILDAALERPLGIYSEPVRFGDLSLDNAELSLRDYLPRPWTATRIHALFLAAYTRLGEARNVRLQDQFFDRMVLVEQLGTILAASRDPRAALALGRVLENSDNRLLTSSLSRSFLDYFGSDASYRRFPAEETVARACFSGCGDLSEDAHKWWLLNQHEVEQRAAAVTAGLPPCAACNKEALTAIDRLRRRLHDSAPTLRLTIKGGGKPRFVQVRCAALPSSGRPEYGARGDWGSHFFTSRDMRINIPGKILGRSDMRLSCMVMSPGYRSVPFEIDRINDARVVPVTLVPISGKTLTGTVMFSSDSAPRRFGLSANLIVSGTEDSTGVPSDTWMNNIAQATVDRNGHFSIRVPDVTQDPILNTPSSHYLLAARDNNWVLLPDVIALDHPPGTALNITVAPRPGSPASKSANPGPLLAVTGRVVDSDGQPVPAAQVVIVTSKQLESLRCPENGDACFPALRAIGAGRASGVSGSDGQVTLHVPVGLMFNDSVWAEGRDADGRSIRTSWQVGPNRTLPTSSLGDIRLHKRMDFTLLVRSDGRPIAGAEVDFDELGRKRTDAAGTVEIHEQMDGSRRSILGGIPITFSAAGFASEAWYGGIAIGKTTQVIELEREAVQRGRVVDAGGRALGNATVRAHAVEPPDPGVSLRDPYPNESIGTARTDDAGAFTLRGLHGGRQYRLVVISADGAVTNGERVVSAGSAPVDIMVPAR